MSTEVRLIQAGMAMQQATITTWFKQPGDAVVDGEPIGECEAEKSVLEILANATGVLTELLVPVGTEVPVRSLLAIIDDVGAAPPHAGSPLDGAPPPMAPPPRSPVSLPRAGGPQVTPAARRLAKELGVPLDAVDGTGPGGRVLDDDVRRVADAAAAPPRAAEHLVGAQSPTRPSDVLALSTDVDVTDLLAALAELPEPVGAGTTDVVLLAALLAMSGCVAFGSERSRHVRVAVVNSCGETAEYLVHDAERLRLIGLVQARQEGETDPGDRPATISIVDVGAQGVDLVGPRLCEGHVASIAAGRLDERLTRVGEHGFAWRTFLALGLAVDAGVVREAEASRFLRAMADYVADPTTLSR